jgi:hypothetical protein
VPTSPIGEGGLKIVGQGPERPLFPGTVEAFTMAVTDSFCKEAVAELEIPYRLNFIQSTPTQDESRLINTFKEL